MTTTTTTVITDDLDGTHGAGSYTFAIGGRAYDIDLTREHYAELVAALAPYVAAGRPATARRTPGRNAIPTRVTHLPAQTAPDPVAFDATPRRRRSKAVG